MLKHVRVENIILIKSAHIPFEGGLNILSGETGAGKSAVMQALRLIAGEKGDVKLIRHGATKAMVEASFEPSSNSPLWPLLSDSGLTIDKNEALLIRREISLQGKSRAFINDQLISLPLLKEVGEVLFDIASQHASQKLTSESFQRNVLEIWGEFEDEVKHFGKSWEKECFLHKEIQELKESEAQRLREVESLQRQIQEIEAAKLLPNEDDDLFQEYSQSVTNEECWNQAEEVINSFSSLPLTRIKSSLESLVNLDPTLEAVLEMVKGAKNELDEAAWQLGQYHQKLSFSPERMRWLDDRLKTISQLKKKYGTSATEILVWLDKQKKSLQTLLSSDEKIEELQTELTKLQPVNHQLAKTLTKKRVKAAEELSEKITDELRLLNMPKAVFYIDIASAERSKTGEDKITFAFCPNVGGKKITIKEGASGGELARILLAVKTTLSGKESAASLIFDEVDANIGGETARMLGEKLSALGKTTQVIAITHFPQVAQHADHHLGVSKVENEGTVQSLVEILTSLTREKELCRMVGKA